MSIKAYGAFRCDSPLETMTIERRAPGPKDVQIDIAYCGICHSDLHTVRSEWAGTLFPCVPGHEIVGHVSAIGGEVRGFFIGETVGVGCLVDSCQRCRSCEEGMEQYCENGFSPTYNGTEQDKKRLTYGGYAEHIIVKEHFVLHLPTHLPLPSLAPLLCAGITTYSPLRHWKVGAGQKVGVVGLGGLGHMGIQFAHALGAHTYAITTSPHKKADALKLGAEDIIVSKDPSAMAQHANSFDFILSTISAPYDLSAYLNLLKRDGTIVIVGAPNKPTELGIFDLIPGRKTIAGSLVGGIQETQEMLDFCGAHNITAEIELISIQEVNEAFERMLKSDVHYRFVIDMSSLN